MARTPSTSDLCNAEANKAYDKLAVISENIDKLNELANYIFDLKDWLKFNIGIYLNDYIIELETKCGELQEKFNHLKDLVDSNKEEVLRVIDGLTDEVASLENQVNDLFLTTFNPNDNTHGATCKAISDFIESKLQDSFLPQIQRLLMPSGTIVIWSGSSSNIPNGWYLCDGTNGTPDLRGRFVLGSNSTHLSGSTGGSATYDMGKHYHYWGHHNNDNNGYFICLGPNGKYSEVPSIPSKTVYAASWNGNNGGGWAEELNRMRQDKPASNGENLITSLNYTNGTDDVSSGNSGETLPPYYSLCYIMKA